MTSTFTNTLKKKLKAGQHTAGAWLHLCNSIAAEILSLAGFDWLLIDMEHGYGDYQTLLSQLQGMQTGSSTPLVRVQWNDQAVIKRVLDIGAQGIMIPWINNRTECEAAISSTRLKN